MDFFRFNENNFCKSAIVLNIFDKASLTFTLTVTVNGKINEMKYIYKKPAYENCVQYNSVIFYKIMKTIDNKILTVTTRLG